MVDVSHLDQLAVQAVTERITAIAQTIPKHVRLIAVSKSVPTSLIRAAYAAGIRDFGESRIQEAVLKQGELTDLHDITWHFIGHLQRNKAKKALQCFDWIHSVDSLSLAQRLNTLAADMPISPQVCLQVKLRPDPQKSGWTLTQIQADLSELQTLPHLHICGLMTILPLGLTSQEKLATFQDTQQLAVDIGQWSQHQLQLSELSMGMSGDYDLAVQAGATMIRLGRSLFQPSEVDG